MYELYILTKSGNQHWAKVTEAELEELRNNIDDEANRDFIEVFCEDNGHALAVNRKEVEVFTYKVIEEVE